MDNQGFLFNPHREPTSPPATDPNTSPADVPRLAGQNATILRLLQRGPQRNADLARVSLKYTSRISDLRAAGFTIVCRRLEDGVTLYTLNP